MDFRTFLKDNLVILDGGMGTLLQKAGLAPGELPERWNLTHADEVTAMFDGYGLCDAEGNKNLTLSFLPQEKQDFVTFMQNATHSDAFTAIRDYR